MPDPRKNLHINKWFSGYSDDDFLGVDGSFWRGVNAEIRRFPRRFQINKRLVDQSGSVVSTPIFCSANLSNADTVIAGADGNIYRRAALADEWTLVHTDATGRDILDMKEFDGYLYWTTHQHLHRIPIIDTGTALEWDNIEADWQTLVYNNTDAHPLFVAFNKLMVGDGHRLHYVDEFGVWTADAIQLETDDLIRNITFKSGSLRLWVRKQNPAVDYGSLVLWNGVSGSYNERVILDGMFQVACAGEGGFDYFIAGQRPWLYRLDGLTGTKLKELPMLTKLGVSDENSISTIFYANSMCARNGVIYFGSPFLPTPYGISTMERGVWSFGRKDDKYPFSLNCEWETGTGIVTHVFVSEGKLIAATSNDLEVTLRVEADDQYEDYAEIETRWLDAGEPEQTKDSKKVAISFFPLNEGEKIEVFVKTNMSTAAFATPILTADYANAADRGKIFKELVTPFVGKEFHTIQFKVKLTCGTDNETTPKLMDLMLGFEDVRPS